MLQIVDNSGKVSSVVDGQSGVGVMDPHVIPPVEVHMDVLDIGGNIAHVEGVDPFPMIICVRNTVGDQVFVALAVLNLSTPRQQEILVIERRLEVFHLKVFGEEIVLLPHRVAEFCVIKALITITALS